MTVYDFGDMLVDPQKYPWGYSFQEWALEFDGSVDYIDIGSLNPYTTELTLEAMFKLADGALSAHRTLFSWGDWDEDVTIYFRSGGSEISVNAGISGRDNVSYTDAVEGTWRHIALTIDTKTPSAIVYMDGDALGTVQCQDGGELPLTRDLLFGQFSNDYYFQGLLREFRIWSVARTQQQIQDNMSKHLMGNETGLVGYWTVNEGKGATVYDRAGSNDGTIHGATWVEI